MTGHIWFRQYDPGVPRTIGRYPERTLLYYPADGVRERLAPYRVLRRLLTDGEAAVA